MGFEKMYGGHDVATYKGRNENDFYPTPPFVTFALNEVENLPIDIWEPACGRGWMSDELHRLGFRVFASDLYVYEDAPAKEYPYQYGIDYLDYGYKPSKFSVSGVVTNPPYGRDLAEKFVRRTMHDYKYGAFLCRLTFAESQKRLKLFNEFPPSRVHVFSQRFSCNEADFDEPLGGMIAFAWWVWDYRQCVSQTTEMNWIDTRMMYDLWKSTNV